MNKTGFGIGLNYVYKTVKSNYGAEGELIITSKKGEGTSIQVTLPMNKEEVHHD